MSTEMIQTNWKTCACQQTTEGFVVLWIKLGKKTSCVTHVLGQSSLKKMRGNERENTRGHRRTNEDDLQKQKWLEWREAEKQWWRDQRGLRKVFQSRRCREMMGKRWSGMGCERIWKMTTREDNKAGEERKTQETEREAKSDLYHNGLMNFTTSFIRSERWAHLQSTAS